MSQVIKNNIKKLRKEVKKKKKWYMHNGLQQLNDC